MSFFVQSPIEYRRGIDICAIAILSHHQNNSDRILQSLLLNNQENDAKK
ncbi:hypothetical protein [Anabaena sp. PCC 7108]|nr:hypothetical protein [Anabaena sp. PCC 7108]